MLTRRSFLTATTALALAGGSAGAPPGEREGPRGKYLPQL
jgi:hypothetical protein